MSKNKHNKDYYETPSPEEMRAERDRQQDIEDIDQQALLTDYKNVMKSPSGVRVLRHILAYTQYRHTPWDKHAGVMSRRVGMAEVGNFITAHMAEADTELYCKLMIFNEDSSEQQGGSV